MKPRFLARWPMFSMLTLAVWQSSAVLANQYSLELTRETEANRAREQANLASGLIPHACRVSNEMANFVVRCGRSDSPAAFTKDIARFAEFKLPTPSVVPVSEDEVVLYQFEAITLDAETQANLLTMAQQQQWFSHQTSSDHQQPQQIDDGLLQQRAAQGKYFIDRGWQALQQQDFSFAETLFNLATQIPPSPMTRTMGCWSAPCNNSAGPRR